MYDKYIKESLKLAKKAYKNNDVPVGCVIVNIFDGEIIACGYNKKNRKQNALYHAELVAIDEACKLVGTWHLDDFMLITTLEPCMMCLGAINEVRIPILIYGTEYKKCKNYNIKQMFKGQKIVNLKNEECSKLLSDFFEKMRKEQKNVL